MPRKKKKKKKTDKSTTQKKELVFSPPPFYRSRVKISYLSIMGSILLLLILYVFFNFNLTNAILNAIEKGNIFTFSNYVTFLAIPTAIICILMIWNLLLNNCFHYFKLSILGVFIGNLLGFLYFFGLVVIPTEFVISFSDLYTVFLASLKDVDTLSFLSNILLYLVTSVSITSVLVAKKEKLELNFVVTNLILFYMGLFIGFALIFSGSFIPIPMILFLMFTVFIFFYANKTYSKSFEKITNKDLTRVRILGHPENESEGSSGGNWLEIVNLKENKKYNCFLPNQRNLIINEVDIKIGSSYQTILDKLFKNLVILKGVLNDEN